MLCEGCSETRRSADRNFPLRGIRRDSFEMDVAAEHGARRFLAPARHAGKPVGRVAHQRQIVRNRLRSDAKARDDAALVALLALAAIELNDAVAPHALAEIL